MRWRRIIADFPPNSLRTCIEARQKNSSLKLLILYNMKRKEIIHTSRTFEIMFGKISHRNGKDGFIILVVLIYTCYLPAWRSLLCKTVTEVLTVPRTALSKPRLQFFYIRPQCRQVTYLFLPASSYYSVILAIKAHACI